MAALVLFPEWRLWWSALLWLAWLAPLLLAFLLLLRPWRGVLLRLAPWAALPALLLALAGPEELRLTVPWLFLGAELALDPGGRLFLLIAAWLWLLAGCYGLSYLAADPRRHRFFFFFLLAMSGNLGLPLAQDLFSFNVFFALMGLAAYGLVVHRRDQAAWRAGRVYIILLMVGEVLIFSALVLLLQSSGSLRIGAPWPADAPAAWLAGLLLAGFGIKAGLLPLHCWLPLAHPAAPAPASSVLSGAMIKAGLLAWLRFLPLGQLALPEWGGVLLALGLAGAFYGALKGLTSRDPKTVLAWSSISQMGLISAAVGFGLGEPAVWPAAQAAVYGYVIHHGLAKGALFLGVGIAAHPAMGAAGPAWRRGLVWLTLLLPALALAGAPFTSGFAVKQAWQEAARLAGFRPDLLTGLLFLSALATSLLLIHFLRLLRAASSKQEQAGREATPLPAGLWLPWGLLVLSGLPWWLGAVGLPPAGAVTATKLALALGPLLVAGLLVWLAGRMRPGRGVTG